MKFTKPMIDAYLSGIEQHPYYAKMAAVKKFSMLHVDMLLLLRLFARLVRGGILEIGPYIGGSSIAIGSGVRDGGGSLSSASSMAAWVRSLEEYTLSTPNSVVRYPW